jgi:hypothetical protein
MVKHWLGESARIGLACAFWNLSKGCSSQEPRFLLFRAVEIPVLGQLIGVRPVCPRVFPPSVPEFSRVFRVPEFSRVFVGRINWGTSRLFPISVPGFRLPQEQIALVAAAKSNAPALISSRTLSMSECDERPSMMIRAETPRR